MSRTFRVILVGLNGRSIERDVMFLATVNPEDLSPMRISLTGPEHDRQREAVSTPKARNYEGQTHISGTYFFSRSGRRVIYESRLEHLRLQLADLDSASLQVATQPFALLIRDETDDTVYSHVPDILLSRRGRPRLLVDVRPWAFQSDPHSRLAFQATREACALVGFDYEVWGEPPVVQAYNVQFLSGFRRAPLRFETIAPLVLDAVGTSATDLSLEEIESLVDRPYLTRPVLLHLIWRGDLQLDLTLPLSSASLVTPGPLFPGERRSDT